MLQGCTTLVMVLRKWLVKPLKTATGHIIALAVYITKGGHLRMAVPPREPVSSATAWSSSSGMSVTSVNSRSKSKSSASSAPSSSNASCMPYSGISAHMLLVQPCTL